MITSMICRWVISGAGAEAVAGAGTESGEVCIECKVTVSAINLQGAIASITDTLAGHKSAPKTKETPVSHTRPRRTVLLAVLSALVVLTVALSAGLLLLRGPGSSDAAASAEDAVLSDFEAEAPAGRPVPRLPATPQAVDTFDKQALSTDDPASLWLVANKTRPITPAGYVPADLVDVPIAHIFAPKLRAEAADAAVAVFAAFTADTGLAMTSQSAYRSFAAQTLIYDRDAAVNGTLDTDQGIARPGHSEHQTGLAIDISAVPAVCSLAACFAETPQGEWLAENAWKYGFLLRYPADKVAVTGFEFEPWHFRYIGVELATEMREQKVSTLEEFFGLPAAPDYL
jgi:D-alanyl-D-alanine carboxypeptidase